jgi:Mn-dependent DtxR family transcriptional regulator
MDKKEEELLEKSVEELTLLLLYLTGWEEEVLKGSKIIRSWKGYSFEVLNALEEKGLISQSKKAKSVYLTGDGHKKAKELFQKYLDLENNPLA